MDLPPRSVGDFQIEQADSIPGKRFYFLPTYSLPPLHRKSTYFIKFLLKICRKSEVFLNSAFFGLCYGPANKKTPALQGNRVGVWGNKRFQDFKGRESRHWERTARRADRLRQRLSFVTYMESASGRRRHWAVSRSVCRETAA